MNTIYLRIPFYTLDGRSSSIYQLSSDPFWARSLAGASIDELDEVAEFEIGFPQSFK